ncbi:LysR substrate-binding domain-containing protein [Dyadobacter tibetensis]|uniref:LysR substrate-binding domain-containing protein n=1 Tax=Dyadobacter tibetensis TaxID=1211851 RepID=UPI0004715B88|nr:LysR substrate-binding domain-containing protein [Dyadobacter tibetensis]
MNIQQLEYIIAVDNHRHFVQAANFCNVTQPTLSMMIRKLEDELGLKIFDRTKQPIVPTGIGRKLIDQARVILRESRQLEEMARFYNGDLSGDLRIGIIPTIAPYLLPYFVQPFIGVYPDIQLHISEMITDRILNELRVGSLDVGILATSSDDHTLTEIPLYQEKFYVYASESTGLFNKKYVLPSDIEPNELWLLEEGHCFRSQIERLCELSRNSSFGHRFNYRSGSIETLMRMVDRNGGLTILPELALHDLTEERKKSVLHFQAPAPQRQISLVFNREQVKSRLIDALKTGIMESVPQILDL